MKSSRQSAINTVPKCPCHLCKDALHECCEEDCYSYLSPNGPAVAHSHVCQVPDAYDVENCESPTIFCPYLDMWRSLWFSCCCTTHDNPSECKNNGDKPCSCPRCCRECRTGDKVLPVIQRDGKVEYHICYFKSQFYTPCNHLRGYCSESPCFFQSVTSERMAQEGHSNPPPSNK